MAKTIKDMTFPQAIYTMQVQAASNQFKNMSLKCTLNNGKTAFMTVLKDQLEMVHKQSYYGEHIVSRSQYVVEKAEGRIFSVAADSIEKIKYKGVHVPV